MFTNRDEAATIAAERTARSNAIHAAALARKAAQVATQDAIDANRRYHAALRDSLDAGHADAEIDLEISANAGRNLTNALDCLHQ